MLALLWNVSAAIRGYLRFYMPTNRALDWLQSPRGLKWAIPAAFIAALAYLYVTSVAAVAATAPGRGWLNILVFLFCWNAMKFAWMALLAPLRGLRMAVVQRAQRLSYDSARLTTWPFRE